MASRVHPSERQSFLDSLAQHRRSYGKAALLLAACAEALRVRKQPERAQELLRRFREEFPRHSAFQAELDAAVQRG